MPSLVAGLGTIFGIYCLGRDAYSRYTGLGAALFLALSSAHIAHSVKARGYAPLALFAVLAFWLACHASRQRNYVAWLLVTLFSDLGMFTIPVMVYPYAVLIAWLLAEGMWGSLDEGYRSRKDFLRCWTASGLGTVLLVFALYTPALMVTCPERMAAIDRVAPNLDAGAIEALRVNFAQVAGTWAGGLPLYVRVLLVAGLAICLLLHRKLSMLAVPMQVVALVVVSVVISVQRPIYDARIWFSFLPLVTLWASAGTVGAIELARRSYCPRIPLAAGFLACGLVLAGTMAVRALGTLPDKWARRGREEQAVLFLKVALRESDGIIAPPSQAPRLRYYSYLYGISLDRMDRDRKFDRLSVISYPAEGETVEVVLRAAGLEGGVGPESARRLTGIAGLEIFELVGPQT